MRWTFIAKCGPDLQFQNVWFQVFLSHERDWLIFRSIGDVM